MHYTPASPLKWEGDYVKLFQGNPVQELLGISIYHGPNFARVSEDINENTLVQKPAYQYLIYIDASRRIKMALLDLYDAKEVMNRMLHHPLSSSIGSTYLLSGTKVIACDSKNRLYTLDPQQDLTQSINILYKLYTGRAALTKKEKEYLQALFAKHSTWETDFKAEISYPRVEF